jgi:CelD/BcsL family acetyltransferase involved in cellulose biosynthesis
MSARLVPLDSVDAAFVEAWRALSDNALEPNPFADPDLVLPAHRWLAEQVRLSVAAVECQGELRFALPVTHLRTLNMLPVRAVATWVHPYCYLGTPLVSRHEPEAAWGEALDLLSNAAPWAGLSQVGADGPVTRSLSATLGECETDVSTMRRTTRPVLRRRPDVAYVPPVSGRHASNLRRLRRRLAEDLAGEVVCVDRASPGPELQRAIDGFLRMELCGWKGRDGGAMACRPEHAEFFRQVCRQFAVAGRLQMWTLEVGARPVAYQCNLLAGRSVFGFKMTFDETLRRYKPGLQLMVDTIDGFHVTAGLDMIDSCTGNDQALAHEVFADRRDLVDLLIPSRGVLGRAVVRALPPAAAIYRRARRLGRHAPARR